MKSKTLNLDHVSVSYLDNDKSSVFTIVFLHGNSSCKETFKKQFADSNLNEYRLIAIDLPGHGQTKVKEDPCANPQIYSFDYFHQITLDFIEALEIKNIVLVGHSLGGHIAINTARRTPQVCGLVISQTPPLDTMEQASLGFNTTTTVLETLYNPAATPDQIEKVIDVFTQSSELKSELRTSWQHTDPQFRINFSTSLVPGYEAKEREALSRTQSPWLILESKDDICMQHNYFTDDEMLRSHMIEISGVRHFPQYDAAPEYNRELLKFLETL